MSQLQKTIARAQRREGGPRIGFGATSREQPKAMALAALVTDGSRAKEYVEAGADIVIVNAADAQGAIAELKRAAGSACTGVLLPSLTESAAEDLRAEGCDFVITSLEGAAAAAVDTEKMGHVLAVGGGVDDTTLRALAPVGLDGLYMDQPGRPMSLAGQLELVRLATLSSTPLLAAIGTSPTISELRVLRDSGTAVVVAPEGTTAEQIGALVASLKSVPAQKKRGREGGEIALVPSMPAASTNHEEEDDDDDE